MTPLLDQELAGFLAKLSTIAVLWTVAFVIIDAGPGGRPAGRDVDPLVWSDVEREIERAERRDRRQGSPGATGRSDPRARRLARATLGPGTWP